MPTTTTELAEFTQQSQESSRRLEQQLADLFPANRPQMRPYTIEGSLAWSDQPTLHVLPAISPLTPLPATQEPEPAALMQPPFTLPTIMPAPISLPAIEVQPSPLVAQVMFTEYTHPDPRSSPQEQIEDGILAHQVIPEKIFISKFCKLILDLCSWGDTYFYGESQIAILAGNWLPDDELILEGNQGLLSQPKTAQLPEPEQLPAWLADIGEEAAPCGIGGDGGDQGVLPLAS
jgi:hypothetical protein